MNTRTDRLLNSFGYLVVLENSQLDFLVLMLVLLGSRVVLLLALLGTTTEAEHQVEGRLLLNVVVRQGPSIFQLLSGEDQTLLVRRNSLKSPMKILKSYIITCINYFST